MLENGFDEIKVSTREFDISTLNLIDFAPCAIKYKNSALPGYCIKKKPEGIIGIQFSTITNDLIIEFSAKILGLRYPELINIYNISDVVDIFNSYGIVTLYKDEFIKYSICLKAHVTKDIKVTDPANQHIQLLAKCELNPKFYFGQYKYSGIFIKPTAKKNKGVFKACKTYNKHEELLLNKSAANTKLLKKIDVKSWENVVRLETEIGNYEAFRKYFDLPHDDPPYLSSVLSSKINVTARVLKDIIQDPCASKLTAKTTGDFKADARDKIFTDIYDKCGNDDSKAFAMIKAAYPKQYYRIRIHYRDWKFQHFKTVVSTDISMKELLSKVGYL